MANKKRKWTFVAIFLAFLVSLIGISGPAGEAPKAEEKEWLGIYKDGKPLPSMNLDKTKAKVDFFYHGPDDGKPRPLEGRVVKETKEVITLGITVWKQDVAFSAYDKVRKTFEIYLTPHHLKDPKEIRIAILKVTEFTAPADVRTVRVVYLP